jgi:hypothetical protein
MVDQYLFDRTHRPKGMSEAAPPVAARRQTIVRFATEPTYDELIPAADERRRVSRAVARRRGSW